MAAMQDLEATLRAARSLLAAGLLSVTTLQPGSAEEVSATQSVVLASQKSKVLEAYLRSPRVIAAERENPGRAGPPIAKARAKLATGRVALEAGQISQAIADFDDGMRALSLAVAAAPGGNARKARAASYATRRGQVASYIATIRQTLDLSTADAARIAEMAKALDKVDALAASGRSEAAAVAVSAVYTDVIRFVSELQKGHTVVVRREFETAADEYAYELERNRSYRLLVRIAVAERGAEQPGLEALAAGFEEASARLREQAETLATVGEHPGAIELMERSTDRLAAVLRASGVLVTE